jgi:DNA invertase Pin-like site-specific DNA recombinase
MKKALGYVRVSSEEQADHGLGLESQRQRIKAYCELKGLEAYLRLVGLNPEQPWDIAPVTTG